MPCHLTIRWGLCRSETQSVIYSCNPFFYFLSRNYLVGIFVAEVVRKITSREFSNIDVMTIIWKNIVWCLTVNSVKLNEIWYIHTARTCYATQNKISSPFLFLFRLWLFAEHRNSLSGCVLSISVLFVGTMFRGEVKPGSPCCAIPF